jgi:hypothetical protein
MLGSSFSTKYARELSIEPKTCLSATLHDLGIRRLRLMSYWDIHEANQGIYDFKELDWQFALASKYKAEVTLAIGLRQPRWPESHWPSWARNLSEEDWQKALLNFMEAVVRRFKDHPCLISWQLENEALLKTFGEYGNFDRKRLKKEFNLVKTLDPHHPIIMSMSDSWGFPFFEPKPDIYAFSIYRYFYDRGRYRHSTRSPLFYRFRAFLIRIIKRRPVFIHELQAEPWGPHGTVRLSLDEQYESMNLERVKEAVNFAKSTNLLPADLWGLEWWYYLKTKHNQPEIWQYMRTILNSSL